MEIPTSAGVSARASINVSIRIFGVPVAWSGRTRRYLGDFPQVIDTDFVRSCYGYVRTRYFLCAHAHH